jgi:hypothetical protein
LEQGRHALDAAPVAGDVVDRRPIEPDVAEQALVEPMQFAADAPRAGLVNGGLYEAAGRP